MIAKTEFIADVEEQFLPALRLLAGTLEVTQNLVTNWLVGHLPLQGETYFRNIPTIRTWHTSLLNR